MNPTATGPARALSGAVVLLVLFTCGSGIVDSPVTPPTTDKQLYAAAPVKYWTRYGGAPETVSVFADSGIPQTTEGADVGAWTFCRPRQSPWPVYWNAGRLESFLIDITSQIVAAVVAP